MLYIEEQLEHFKRQMIRSGVASHPIIHMLWAAGNEHFARQEKTLAEYLSFLIAEFCLIPKEI